jgi:phenylalanyl-tRNA synthetase beta chain
LTGGWEEDAWYGKRRPIDFYDIKGVVEVLVKGLGQVKTSINKTDDPLYHPGQRASLKAGDTIIGTFGLLHPVIVRNYELSDDVFAAELDLDKAAANMARKRRVEAPSRFPAVTRDVALLVSADTKVEEIRSLVKKAGGQLLADTYPFDLFKGKNIPQGKKSIAYRLSYQALDRTLTVEEVDSVHAQVIETLKKEIGARIR